MFLVENNHIDYVIGIRINLQTILKNVFLFLRNTPKLNLSEEKYRTNVPIFNTLCYHLIIQCKQNGQWQLPFERGWLY